MSEEAEEGDDAEGSPLPQGEAIGAAGAISAINDINAVGTIDAGGAADAAGAIDVVVLAGGTGRRLGGASKPDVVARGARLLDHVLTGLAALSGPSRSSCPAGSAGRVGRSGPSGAGAPRPGRVVVVAPERVALPPGVLRALEDPPLGGPVAGIAAGLARLARAPGPTASAPAPAALTAVVTCDAPESWRALPALIAAASQGADGACAREGDHVQYLLGVYRTAALTRCAAPEGTALRDVSVRRALGGLEVVRVDLGGLRAAARDLDTWEDVHAWDRAGGAAGGTAPAAR